MSDRDPVLDRLNRLEAAEAARAATWRYADGLDRGDLGVVMETFTPNAEMRARDAVFRGRQEIEAYFRDALAAPHRTAHFMLNQQVGHQAGSEIEVRSGFLFTAAGLSTSILGWGEYLDRVVIEDGVGRFTYKEITIHAMGDVAPGWATA